jgi:iron complex outermembrane receptor protein
LKLFDGLVRVAGGARWENVQIKIDDFHTLAQTTQTLPAAQRYWGGVDVAGGKPKFDDVLLNGGVMVEPWDGVRAYASYAEGYTAPDVGRITRSINQTGVDIDSYLAIEPIVSNNREIGVEMKRGPFDGSATYFWSSSDKGQLLVPGTGRNFDVQRQRIEIEGLEVNLRAETPIEGLKLGIGYAHIEGRYDSNADGAVDTDLDGVNISPDRVNLSATYVRGPVSAPPDQRNNFGGYVVTDASIRYQTGFGGIRLSVQNLFDKFYIDYSSDTRLPTDNLAYFAGRGRSFTLSWDYAF